MSVKSHLAALPSASFLFPALFFLFSLQLVTDFVEGIYAFGLFSTGIPIEVVSIVLFFSPLILVAMRKGLSTRALLCLGWAMLACRAVEPFLDTRGRMLLSGLGVALLLVFLPAWLWRLGQRGLRDQATPLSQGLTIGVALAILFRTLASGYDLTTDHAWGVWLGVLLAALAAVMLPGELNKTAQSTESPPPLLPPPGFARLLAWSIGLAACWTLLYFAFASPSVLARWTELPYTALLPVIGVGLVVAASLLGLPILWRRLTLRQLRAWNILFVLGLADTLLLHQVAFPADPQAYPLFMPHSPVTIFGWVAQIFMLFFWLVILINFSLYLEALLAARPSLPRLGATFSLAALFLLIMILAQVFTTVYDYIPVLGPMLRDRFWLVYALLGLAMFLPLFSLPARFQRHAWPPNFRPMLAVLSLSITAVIAALILSPRPTAPPPTASLRVLTYNVQQGYSGGDRPSKNPDRQLEVMRQLQPDLIGLQETDANRIANGNADLVRYFADNLDMYSYYGPTTVVGTFGVALLSRYPIENPRTFFMFSQGEQTACIAAQVSVNGRLFNVFVTHLGNGGPLIQQQQVLQEAQGLPNLILMGDFNFRPDTEQYRLATGLLTDAWLLKWPGGVDDQGHDPARRIDHIFLSPDLQILDARFWTGDQSDHPALWIDIR